MLRAGCSGYSPEPGNPGPYRVRTDEHYYAELLRPIFAGRPVIVTGGPVAGLSGLARAARRLGAPRVFVLGTEGRGSGDLPTEDETHWLALDVSATSMLEGVRAGQRLLADLPAHARRAIEQFDPDGDALVIATFLNELPEVAGRPCLGYRRPEWVAMEDKIVADALWDRAGVSRAPSAVVPAERAVLVHIARQLDQGLGTVWAADARDGYHGGAEYLRWVRDDRDVSEAVAFLGARADHVRVMPFLEGVPCSIHGVVFDGHIAALRPLEMVTLRRRGKSTLFYAGVASFWDPSPDDRASMRDVARRVGQLLRTEVGFRGPFTVDGVLTVEGFRPTELNPRSGAGLQVLAAGFADLPLVNAAISAGLDLDFRPIEFERLVVEHADERPGGGTWRVVPLQVPEMVDRPVWLDGPEYRWSSGSAGPDGWVTTGPSATGGFVRLTFNPARTPVGRSVAERAAKFWQFADTALGTQVGPLLPARQLR